MPEKLDISIVLPIYNEEGNLKELHSKLTENLVKLGLEYEIIAVDDGSKDNSFNVLKELTQSDPRLKVIRFRTNFGQTAAMSAGFHHAKGDVIITMDSDLQNDPEDIPRLLEKINEGYDVVSGWRAD
ncbi:MAG: glycosyltransferase family 2 protein, partial [Candidatus Poribacteria bacterium]